MRGDRLDFLRIAHAVSPTAAAFKLTRCVPSRPQFTPYGWALSTREIGELAGIEPAEVLRFDGNTPPDPPPVATPATVAGALERINAYAHGGFPELLQAIADYNGVEPENVVLGAGADDILMLCARAYAGPRRPDLGHVRADVPGVSGLDVGRGSGGRRRSILC